MAEFPEVESGKFVRLEARVEGVVQGVGFRYRTVCKAQELALTGTVRNNDDGSVAVVAEGPQAVVLEFRRWLRSPAAPGRVENVEEELTAATGRFSSFQVMF